jgi:uncharacterized protein (DUF488 family)
MGRQLFTIGYEGTRLPEFLNELTAAGVQTLVDVRELPQSRIPGYSKTALSAALKQKGIEYIHMRELGSPRELRHELRENGNFAAFTWVPVPPEEADQPGPRSAATSLQRDLLPVVF